MESVAAPSSRGRRTERLTEDQRRELRQMRKRQRVEHKKRKILKLDDEGVGLYVPLATVCYPRFDHTLTTPLSYAVQLV